ncbi:MAG: hypothetical protein ACTSUX_12360 [Promethearchaeota archaeon]
MSQKVIYILSKQKVLAEDIILAFIIITIMIMALSFRVIIYTAIIIYPMIALIIYGGSQVKKAIKMEYEPQFKRFLRTFYGFLCMSISAFIIIFILSPPTDTLSTILELLAFPLISTGFAGIIKGIIITDYPLNLRIWNIIIGVITMIFSIYGFTFPYVMPLNLIFILLILLALNFFFRAAIYLSEFGLSIIPLRNLKIVFLIVNGYYLYLEEEFNK